MTISRNLRIALGSYGSGSYAGEYFLNCGDSTLIPMQVVLDLTKDELEVPMFINLRNIVNSWGSSNNYTKLVLSLNTGRSWVDAVSPEVMMKNICATCYNDERLRKGTKSGETFYGGNGFLMDANYNVLMMVSKIITKPHCCVKQFKVHLHPKLFVEEENSLNKILTRKVPYYYLSTIQNTPVEIVVNKSDDIIKPILSKPITTENVPKFLQENIADIIEQFKQVQ